MEGFASFSALVMGAAAQYFRSAVKNDIARWAFTILVGLGLYAWTTPTFNPFNGGLREETWGFAQWLAQVMGWAAATGMAGKASVKAGQAAGIPALSPSNPLIPVTKQ